MRVFDILNTSDNLSFINQKSFYTMLLGILLFNYFYVILFGGISLLYMWFSNFSISSLVTGYFVHYLCPFELDDFMLLTDQLKTRISADMNNVLQKIEWKKPALFVNSNDVEEISNSSDDDGDKKSEDSVLDNKSQSSNDEQGSVDNDSQEGPILEENSEEENSDELKKTK